MPRRGTSAVPCNSNTERSLEIYRGISELSRRLTRPVVTIGNFDGVHRGHQAILNTVTERAAALDGESVLYTLSLIHI